MSLRVWYDIVYFLLLWDSISRPICCICQIKNGINHVIFASSTGMYFSYSRFLVIVFKVIIITSLGLCIISGQGDNRKCWRVRK